MHRALANKRAADSRALALQRGLANELNRRGIPAAGGGRWHRTAVTRMLTRLGHLVSVKGGTNNGLATKRVADVRAGALRPTIRKLRKAGFNFGRRALSPSRPSRAS
jgi:hypothetical protein